MVQRFSQNEFWKWICCIFYVPYFDVGGQIFREKDYISKKLSEYMRNSKCRNLWRNVDIFKYFSSYVACAVTVYFIYIP